MIDDALILAGAAAAAVGLWLLHPSLALLAIGLGLAALGTVGIGARKRLRRKP